MPRPRLAADSDVRPMRTAKSSIRPKLGVNAANPAYIFTQLRVGYRMPKGGGAGTGGGVRGRLTPLTSMRDFIPIELVLKYLDR